MNERQRRHLREALPLILICLALLAYGFASALNYTGQVEKMQVLSGEQVQLIPDVSVPNVLKITLPESFDGEQSLCFYSVYQEVHVRLDGVEIYSFLKPEKERIMGAAPSFWNEISVPAGNAGKLLEIELITPYEQYAGVLPEVRSGTAEQVNAYVVMKTVPRFAAALAILCIGIVFAIVAVVMRYYTVGNNGLYSLSLFIVVLALFLVTQQTTILLEINSSIPYILVQHIALMLCPVMYTLHLIRLHSGRQRSFDRLLYWAGIINFVLVILLHIFTEVDMPQMMLFTRVLCAGLIVYEFVQELRRRRRVLIVLITLATIYAVLRYYFTDKITWLVYAGIFAYMYLMIYRVITAIVQAQAKQIRLEAQLEVSKSEIATVQITSHFFYHTLDSIRALIRMDADRAYKMTGDFAKYIRHRVDGVERLQETVPFSRELRSIRAYTDIKRAQLGERFQMIFDVETQDFEILPLTVQPLIENAVIHAVQRRREGGMVRLSCRETQTGYRIEVEDNGPGPGAPPEIHDEQKQSTAIKNMNTRLEFYGIAPPVLVKNELGGITAILETPKNIVRKGNAE